MDDKLNALDRLIEAVEAGEIRTGVTGLKSFEQFSRDAFGLYQSNAAWRAYGGSLDAALALHEVLLPGWIVHDFSNNSRSMGWTMVIASEAGDYHTSHAGGKVGFCETPARAWLLAVLKAYRSMEA